MRPVDKKGGPGLEDYSGAADAPDAPEQLTPKQKRLRAAKNALAKFSESRQAPQKAAPQEARQPLESDRGMDDIAGSMSRITSNVGGAIQANTKKGGKGQGGDGIVDDWQGEAGSKPK